MKQKDIFTLAVRILGLVFLYHGLTTIPATFSGFSFTWVCIAAFYLAAAWWLLTTRWLIRLVYSDKRQEESTELAAGIGKKTDA